MQKKSLAKNELEDFDKVFKALAHPARRNILVVLQARGNRMMAGDIAKRFSCKWPTITRHLKQLQEAGLVSTEKSGREHIYILNTDRLKKVVLNWLRWF
ncbi:metalloregulator ArsR/SmtB family transcription factor [bacterium]|nr:metalloregulator ArsR/SmtB family transcription factor [bacterium]